MLFFFYINRLKKIILIIFYKGFFPYFKETKILYTHLYTTLFYILYTKQRTISMCQAFGQRSIRAIIKLNDNTILTQTWSLEKM